MLRLPDPVLVRQLWLDAQPFPHVVLPSALDADEAAEVAGEFPEPGDSRWHVFTGPLESGKCEATAAAAGPKVAALHDWFASDTFVGWAREVSGIPDLVPDPSRKGGGIHQSGPTARLFTHVDFNVLGDTGLIRAVNVILFVGIVPLWPDVFGGMLELGAPDDPLRVDVPPVPGTFVMFETSDTSWHGHPKPLHADAWPRRSLPVYLYRPIRDGEQVDAHSTRFWEER